MIKIKNFTKIHLLNLEEKMKKLLFILIIGLNTQVMSNTINISHSKNEMFSRKIIKKKMCKWINQFNTRFKSKIMNVAKNKK